MIIHITSKLEYYRRYFLEYVQRIYWPYRKPFTIKYVMKLHEIHSDHNLKSFGLFHLYTSAFFYPGDGYAGVLETATT